MASDYEAFEIRDAQYIFSANGTSGNGNATQTKVFLEKDGTANAIVQQGSSPSYTRGTWSENADKTLNVVLGSEYVADYCDDPGREGYRLVFNSNTMFASVSGENIDYTDKDFDGETLRTLSCGERDYTVDLTEKGVANIYSSNGAKVAAGRYTEENGVLTVVIAGNTYVSDADGNIALQFTVVSGGGPFGRSTQVDRTFPIDGSLPPEVSASGESSGEASGETSGEASGETSDEASGEASGEAS